MRIALTCNFSPWSAYSGGAQRSTHALATALSARGNDVTVVYTACPWAKPETPSDVSYRVQWAPFFALQAQRSAPLRPLNALSIHAALRKLDAQKRLDVVHSQGEEGALVNRLPFRQRLRFIATARYPKLPDGLHPNADLLTRARLWALHTKYPLLGQTLASADQACATSTSAQQELTRAFGLSNATVIPNGVDESFFEVNWGGPREDAPLLFFGRVEADKGIHTLLYALVNSPRTLRIVGRGSALSECRALAARLGIAERVRFEGWMSASELCSALAECALAVLPSQHESFGNAMAEAMCAGVPLITTRAGSIPELTGESALLVEPGDSEQLSKAVSELLADPGRAENLAARGRERMRGKFSWTAVAEAYEFLYASAR